MNVILNTSEIIRQFMTYDPYFSFYENGIKDVVKNAVLVAGKGRPSRFEDMDSEVHWLRSLAGRTISDWEYAVDTSLEYSPADVHAYQSRQEAIDRNAIEFVVEQVRTEVEKMIYGLTNTWRYSVKPVRESSPVKEWQGDDLVVRIHLPQEDA